VRKSYRLHTISLAYSTFDSSKTPLGGRLNEFYISMAVTKTRL